MREKQENMRGIGYFDTVFSAVELPTMAIALKQFALDHKVKADTEDGEVLNFFVSTLIKQVKQEEFETLASQLFSYPKHFEGSLEVESVGSSKEELSYLKKNIDSLLQEEIEVMSDEVPGTCRKA